MNINNQKQCKKGTNCPFVKKGTCKYNHPICDNGIQCEKLKKRQCGFFHPTSHFEKTQNNNDNNNKSIQFVKFSKSLRADRSKSYQSGSPSSNQSNLATKEIACIFYMRKGCQGECQGKYGHPNANAADRAKYYCPFGDGCKFNKTNACKYKHDYPWGKGSAPVQYECQFHTQTPKGCASSADQCYMYHPAKSTVK